MAKRTSSEPDWLVRAHPKQMLKFLDGRASDRKLRLFSVACCRRVWHLIRGDLSRQAIEALARYADGLADKPELEKMRRRLQSAWSGGAATRWGWADWAANEAVRRGRAIVRAEKAAIFAADALAAEAGGNPFRPAPTEKRAQADLLRDLFGNPFRPVTLAPAWLGWNDRCVVRLAEAIYAERAFDRMPILGDALEEAGCTEETILSHCRLPAEHARGCWVLDGVLHKQ